MDWKAKERIFLTQDMQRAVPGSDPGAAYLLAGQGCAVDAATVRRYGLEPFCFSPETVEEIVVEAMSRPNPDGHIRLSDPVADAARRYQEQQAAAQGVRPKARKPAGAGA
jgi:hypothetical protein